MASMRDAAPPVPVAADSTNTNVVQGVSSAEAGPNPKIMNDVTKVKGIPMTPKALR